MYANDPNPPASVTLTKPLTSLFEGPVYSNTPVPDVYANDPNPPESVALTNALLALLVNKSLYALPSLLNCHLSSVSFQRITVFAPACGLFAIISTVASVVALAFSVIF